MWVFCLRSLIRQYGWRFIARVGATHPWRTLQAFHDAAALDAADGTLDVGAGRSGGARGRVLSVVGAGFCLKPLDPPCPSGRFSHDCVYLERSAGAGVTAAPGPCGGCAIRDLGARALGAGAAFYVMTSARDILDDIFVPAMRQCAFTSGLFVLCRYSFRPFAFGLLASGMSGCLLPLEQGDCRDYRTWLLADRGTKDEQTTIGVRALGDATKLLPETAYPRSIRVERRGNVLHPVGQQSSV
jgi:hypothetical protein